MLFLKLWTVDAFSTRAGCVYSVRVSLCLLSGCVSHSRDGYTVFPGVETGRQSVATVDASAQRTRRDVLQPHRHYGSKVRSRLGMTSHVCVCVTA